MSLLRASPIDFDNDGKTDIAVWRPGDGNWYIRNSAIEGDVTIRQWGEGSLWDIPVPGDYDGNGKTDIAVWRPGDWELVYQEFWRSKETLRSSNGDQGLWEIYPFLGIMTETGRRTWRFGVLVTGIGIY